MDQETFNLSIRKFLKMVGVNSQREIEQAVQQALQQKRLSGGETLAAVVRLREPVALDHGAKRAVEDQDALPEQGFELCSAISHKNGGRYRKTLMQKAVILR